MISSRRLRNSGRNVLRTASITSSRIASVITGWSRYSEPALLVRMITASLKLATRPWASVSRPSSMICSSTSSTRGWAFSTSSNKHHRRRALAHLLGQLPAALVAHVAGRGADQPVDGVVLLVLAHVEHHHRVFVAEHEIGQRLGQLGLADARGAEEQERTDGPLGVLQTQRGRSSPPG